MKAIQTAAAIALIILNSLFIFPSCKKAGETGLSSKDSSEMNAKKIITAGRKSDDPMPSYREFYFPKERISYTKPIAQEKDESKRVLLNYINSQEEKLFKYLLVETNADASWQSVYVISKKMLPPEIDLYQFEILQDQVINYDMFIKNGINYIVNGVQIDNINYSLDDPITASEKIAPPKCNDGVFCLDSWLITYSEESGIIYFIEYDPICGPVLCDGGGAGGGNGPNPADPPSFPTMEEAQNILDQSFGEETYHTYATPGSGTFSPQTGIIKKARMIDWDFYDMHIYGGAHVKHIALFSTILFKHEDIPHDPWKWESFVYSHQTQSSGYTLGGYPPCIEGIMDVGTACAISSNQLTTNVALDYHLTINVTCVGGMKWKEFQGMFNNEFAAAAYIN